MNKQEIINRLEAMLAEDRSFNQLLEELEQLNTAFMKSHEELTPSRDNTEVQASEGLVADELPESSLDIRFKELNDQIHAKAEKLKVQKAAGESENLNIKRAIIEELKALTEKEFDSLGDAFKKFNDLKEKWRNTGPVPFKQYQSLQHEYRFLNEQFLYTIKIFKDLKELDLKRNKQLKEELIERTKKLLETGDVKELEAGIRAIQNEWDEIGPTFDEDWMQLRESFKELLNQAYEKLQAYHHSVYERLMKNYQDKLVLVEQLENLDFSGIAHSKAWEELTREVLEIQKQYKQIGAARKKENEMVWERFRAASNKFFESKNQFYSTLKEVTEENKSLKQALVDAALELKDSDDWKTATENFIKLQQEWKKIGTAAPAIERKLWEAFKASADDFFNRKKEYFSTMDARQEENLNKKQSLIARMLEFQPTGNTEEDLKTIDQFQKNWEAIDHVPRKDKDRILKLYQDAIESLYSKLKIDQEELDKLKFARKLEDLKQSGQSRELLSKERMQIKEQLNKIEQMISQYENNMAFFSRAKNASELLKDTLQQVDNARKEADKLREKLKMLVSPPQKQADS